jgi:hypothetical protein
MFNPKTLILPSTYPADLSPPNTTTHHRFRRRLTTALHVVGLLVGLIAISLFAASIPRWNNHFFHNAGPERGDWTDGMPLGPLTFAFLYHVVVLAHGRVRQSQQPHAAAAASSGSPFPSSPSLSRWSLIVHTAVPGLVLASLFPSLLIAVYGSLFRFWRPAVHDQSGVVSCSLLNVFAEECEPTLYAVGRLQLGGVVFGAFVGVVHFALLLIALRNSRRYTLIRQIQRDKLAQFRQDQNGAATMARRTSHGRRRGPSLLGRLKGGSTRHDTFTSLPPPSRSRTASLGDNVQDAAGMPAQPTHSDLVQSPEQSHPPVSLRYG